MAEYRLTVEDDGVGMKPQARSSLGLTSMRERAALAGGELHIGPGAARRGEGRGEGAVRRGGGGRMKLLIVDDHPVMRFGVRQLVMQRWPDAEIGEASCLAQALEQVRAADWELVSARPVDARHQRAGGPGAAAPCSPRTRLLVLSMHDEAAYAARALQLGAAGYLTKEHATTELVAAIERVRGGQRYISSDLAARLADLLSGEAPARAPHETLSAQEYRVLLLIAAGRSASEIADAMHLSVKTVGTYRSRDHRARRGSPTRRRWRATVPSTGWWIGGLRARARGVAGETGGGTGLAVAACTRGPSYRPGRPRAAAQHAVCVGLRPTS